jgi:hypothetical protein
MMHVKSSRITSVRFDGDSGRFYVFFSNGHTSMFTNVPETLFAGFITSTSKDAFAERRIFAVFPEKKLA